MNLVLTVFLSDSSYYRVLNHACPTVSILLIVIDLLKGAMEGEVFLILLGL